MIGSLGASLKPLALSVLGSNFAAAARIPALARSEALTILNFHRVDDEEGSAGAAINPALFDDLVSWLKRIFVIVTFGDLRTRQFGSRPPLILSFDDGYKDFIDIVVPIVEKHGLRVNQNLIPAALDSGFPPMNVQLQDFIRTAPAALLREDSASWAARRRQSRRTRQIWSASVKGSEELSNRQAERAFYKASTGI